MVQTTGRCRIVSVLFKPYKGSFQKAGNASRQGLGPQQNVSGTLRVPTALGTRSVPDTLQNGKLFLAKS
jgi:hypothetical protein